MSSSKRARLESAPDSEEVLAELLQEVQQLEQASKERESAFYKSLSEKARGLIADVKRESDVILLDAQEEAGSILAGAVEETKKWEAEKQKWEAEKTALAGVQQFEPIVKLDVGGVRVTTSLTTLRRFPDTMMGSMFSGRHTLPKGEDGYFFIDRDGTHFRHILNFLRSPESYKMEVEGADARELRRECEFYCLDELMFPPSTEKTLTYFSITAPKAGTIAVRVNPKGVHTILDSGEKIECCSRCHSGLFRIGTQMCFVPKSNLFHDQSPPAAHPKVQGLCPACRQQN
jgi:hypothetical protein